MATKAFWIPQCGSRRVSDMGSSTTSAVLLHSHLSAPVRWPRVAPQIQGRRLHRAPAKVGAVERAPAHRFMSRTTWKGCRHRLHAGIRRRPRAGRCAAAHSRLRSEILPRAPSCLYARGRPVVGVMSFCIPPMQPPPTVRSAFLRSPRHGAAVCTDRHPSPLHPFDASKSALMPRAPSVHRRYP